MLINRYLYNYLLEWKNRHSRLPLILYGARQVGKTTLIHSFGTNYDQYLYFNLEKKVDRDLFGNIEYLDSTLQLLLLTRGASLSPDKSTLLFIDEVQEVPAVIEALRYLYEDYPQLHVIVTGSLLEFALTQIQKTPIGRVEYAVLHPVNFIEFLNGMENKQLVAPLNQVPMNNDLTSVYYKLFHEYALIGGMPGILNEYLQSKEISRIAIHLYAAIPESYKQDVEKYAENQTQKTILRHILDSAPYAIDHRINMNKFGDSSFHTREVKAAMLALQKARIIDLVYPTTQSIPPIIPDYKKQPRLHYLDVGLINYQLGLHQELLTIHDLHQSSRGKLVQQIINQEIKPQFYLPGVPT